MLAPCCLTELDSSEYGLTPETEKTHHATLDCYHCGTLLLLEDGTLKDFHKTMHEEYPAWPVDGKGAGCIEV